MTYQIKIQGMVDATWSDWFSGMDLTVSAGTDGAPITTLTGPVVDQATLRGLLNRIWDLNLTILSIAQIDCEDTIHME